MHSRCVLFVPDWFTVSYRYFIAFFTTATFTDVNSEKAKISNLHLFQLFYRLTILMFSFTNYNKLLKIILSGRF